MADPKYRNIKWSSGEEASIADCPLQKNIMEHIGCPHFGGMRDKEKREQVVPQQYLGLGNVKRVTHVGCFNMPVAKAPKGKKGESAAPPEIDTTDTGEAVAVNKVPVVKEERAEGPQPGDGKSQAVTEGPRVFTDDVGNEISQAEAVRRGLVEEKVPPAPQGEPAGKASPAETNPTPLTCNCGSDEWCGVCKGKMGKPDGSGKATPVADPEPQSPVISADPGGQADTEDDRRAARDSGVAAQSDEEIEAAVAGESGPPVETTKEKDLKSQINSAKKGKKGKKGKKTGAKQSTASDLPPA